MDDMHIRIKGRIIAFEAKYKMGSEEFQCRYDMDSVGDDMNLIEWAATLEMRGKIRRTFAMISKD